MYYKEKKKSYKMKTSLNQFLLNNFLPRFDSLRSYRLCIIAFLIIILFIYFYSLLMSDYGTIITQLNSKNVLSDYEGSLVEFNFNDKRASSVIIDALVKQDSNSKPIYTLVTQFINGIYFYNMNEPVEAWWPFECIRTKMKQSINTQLCIHDPRFDRHISAQLKENGLWEPTNVRSFLKQLKEVPDANVIDIGANIGLYTLLSAKLNRTVIAIEPLHENLNRMHKAAHLESVQSRIIALVNAVSNERKQLKLSIVDNNIGGSHVLNEEFGFIGKPKFSLTSTAVIVNSILLDDLVDVYKIKINNKSKRGPQAPSKKFVIKLDIEGYEPFIFEKSDLFFKHFEVVSIFMEFGKIMEKIKENEEATMSSNDAAITESNAINYLTRVKSMLNLFKRLNFEPYEVNGFNKLDYEKWREWPWDIYLRQCDLVHCTDHFYKLGLA